MRMYGYKILIIDSDEKANGELQKFLVNEGFGVISAYDGSMGMQMINSYRPDLVVMEVDLPGMDGFELLDGLREKPELRQIPVIFVTRLTSENLMIKALEHGGDDYIVKPYNKLELMARVKSSLRRGKRFRQSESSTVGNLADISLPELLQTMELGKKTVHLSLPDMGGDLYVEKGTLVHAKIGSSEGVPAIQRIVFLEHGYFTISFEPFPKTLKKEQMSIQSVLMDTMRYVDELRRILEGISKEKNPLLRINDTGLPEIDKFKDLSPITLNDLVIKMEGDLKESAEKIMQVFSKGKILTVSHALS